MLRRRCVLATTVVICLSDDFIVEIASVFHCHVIALFRIVLAIPLLQEFLLDTHPECRGSLCRGSCNAWTLRSLRGGKQISRKCEVRGP